MSNLSFLFPLVSGLSGSKEVAQSQVSVGMGLLAGSTVLLLTIIWGTCVIVGKCDIEDSIAIDSQDTRGFSLTGMSFDIVQYLILTSLVFTSVNYPKSLRLTYCEGKWMVYRFMTSLTRNNIWKIFILVITMTTFCPPWFWITEYIMHSYNWMGTQSKVVIVILVIN